MSNSKARAQVVKLGVFVVTVVAVLVLALVLIGGLRVRRRPVDTYYVVTEHGAFGLELDSHVTMRGVEVGRVAAIELDRDDFGSVTIELAIDASIAVPATSKAYIEPVGVTGQRVVDITGGTLADGRLPPGSRIPRGETTLEALESLASELDEDLPILLADARELVGHSKEVVTAVDPERLAAIMRAVDPERVEAIVVSAERTAKTLESTGTELERAVVDGRGHLADMRQDVEAVADRASTVLEHADDASQQLSGLIVSAAAILRANEGDVQAAIGNIRRMSRDARALARALRLQPSLLLRSTPPPERELP